MTFACRLLFRAMPLAMLLAAAPGCGLLFGGAPPAQVNIQLRKENQALRDKVAAADAKSKADAAVIAGLRERTPSIPTLPATRLANLYTTHGLKFGRLTGGWDRESKSPGDEGVRVFVAPIDDDGQPLKAAGSFVVEAFDLAAKDAPAVGQWAFDLAATKQMWRGALLDYNYVLECPWQAVPKHAELTLKITFLDELTQVPFHDQQVVKVVLPTGGPATNASMVPTTSAAPR